MNRHPEGPFDSVGWGPFALPGERRRLREAEELRQEQIPEARKASAELMKQGAPAAPTTAGTGLEGQTRLAGPSWSVQLASLQLLLNLLGRFLGGQGSAEQGQRLGLREDDTISVVPADLQLDSSDVSQLDEQLSADLELPIEHLNLMSKSQTLLKAAGINTVSDLVSKSEEELTALPGFAHVFATEVEYELAALGLQLADKRLTSRPARVGHEAEDERVVSPAGSGSTART